MISKNKYWLLFGIVLIVSMILLNVIILSLVCQDVKKSGGITQIMINEIKNDPKITNE